MGFYLIKIKAAKYVLVVGIFIGSYLIKIKVANKDLRDVPRGLYIYEFLSH